MAIHLDSVTFEEVVMHRSLTDGAKVLFMHMWFLSKPEEFANVALGIELNVTKTTIHRRKVELQKLGLFYTELVGFGVHNYHVAGRDKIYGE